METKVVVIYDRSETGFVLTPKELAEAINDSDGKYEVVKTTDEVHTVLMSVQELHTVEIDWMYMSEEEFNEFESLVD